MRLFGNFVKRSVMQAKNVVTRYTLVLCRTLLPFICLLLGASAKAQQATAPPETRALQELVAEVRELRLAMERTNSISLRLQITFERIQLQQNQVSRISSQLESLRNAMVKSQADQKQAESDLTSVESRIDQEQNPNNQKELQGEQKYMKALVEERARIFQDQQTREGELASSLQAEQAKLNELQTRLDSLETGMEPRRPQ
jgi:chromosome segregation ATPase